MPGFQELGGSGTSGASINDPIIVNGSSPDLPNAQQLSSVLGYGTLGSRPTAASTNLYWYYNDSGTGQWYQNLNGSTWTAITPLGTDVTKATPGFAIAMAAAL